MATSAEVTKQTYDAVLATICAVTDAIRDLGSVPSGELYARLMDRMSLQAYQGILDALTRARLITRFRA